MKELKLKEGDKVFDSVQFPNIEGFVHELKEYVEGYLIHVKFGEHRYTYTRYGQPFIHSMPTLSLEHYEVNLNIVTEKAETFEFGEKCMYFNSNVVFLKYSTKNDGQALIAYSTGELYSVVIKDLTKIS
jgi:hypothetical protein